MEVKITKNLEDKIKEDIIAKCPACKKESYFINIGRQQIKDGFISLYNCVYCHTTRAEENLRRYNNNSLIFISHKVYKMIEKDIQNNSIKKDNKDKNKK